MLVDRALELQLFEGRFQPEALQNIRHMTYQVHYHVRGLPLHTYPTSFMKLIYYTLQLENLHVHCSK